MSIFFTADTHFYHDNIRKYSNRPYESVVSMNLAMITNWNKKVSNKDDIYILGDFAFCDGETANKLLQELRGRKHFITGNHDRFLQDRRFDKNLFASMNNYKKLNINGQKIIMFHYPIVEWDCKFHGAIHLYGHIHNNPTDVDMSKIKNAFNVGVDVNNFEPVSLEEINKMFAQM